MTADVRTHGAQFHPRPKERREKNSEANTSVQRGREGGGSRKRARSDLFGKAPERMVLTQDTSGALRCRNATEVTDLGTTRWPQGSQGVWPQEQAS